MKSAMTGVPSVYRGMYYTGNMSLIKCFSLYMGVSLY